MPSPIAKGIIITLSIIVAGGLAVYENPQVRQWIDQSRQKIAMALHSLGDDINPPSRSPRPSDPSMREDDSEMAEFRRRQARAEIIERGRILEERRKRSKLNGAGNRSNGVDNPLDAGHIAESPAAKPRGNSTATTTSADPQTRSGLLTSRKIHISDELHESVDSPMALRQLDCHTGVDENAEQDPFPDHYEQEMRNAWDMPLIGASRVAASSHASESLIDLTPTSETAPDPAVSIPDSAHLKHPVDRSGYFSATASASSDTLSRGESGANLSRTQRQPQVLVPQGAQFQVPVVPESSSASVAGSIDHVHASDLDESEDGMTSEFGDGVRTPASAWTDVGSTTSDFEH